ncbi:cation transporter [Hydrogenophaga sp. RWCD_12]|uniref:cation transporter n=1 Tax=Hydrogenophaga sp. RWCD_12 TaxID=3391190 RepID=UPI00398504DD
MSCECHDHCTIESRALDSVANPAWRRALWIALVLNALMFAVELTAGLQADSVSLLADAVDFAGDAANYALSLAVLGMAVVWRSRAAMVKGLSMAAYGLFVIGKAFWVLRSGTVPEPMTMGLVGALALVVNAGVAVLLYAFRTGDANMRSVWLCSRNDALSNIAVMLAALGVFGTGSAWPDLVVAAVMAVLALTAGVTVVREARRELEAVPA